MPEYTPLEKIRLEKIDELRAEGIEPYPTRAERTHTSMQIIAEFEAAEKGAAEGETIEVKATLAGRIRAARPMGKLIFAHIEDGDGKIQLFFRVNELGQDRLAFFNEMFDLGDFIQAAGVMMRTRSGEATLLVHDFKLLAKAVTPLPAAKDETLDDGTVVRHAALEDAELRARQRYADLAVNTEHMQGMRDRLDSGIREVLGMCSLNGHPERRLPNTLSLGFEGLRADAILSEAKGIAASAGAACHTGAVSVSSVLSAMNVPIGKSMGTIRFSTGKPTTPEDVDEAIREVVRVVRRLSGSG